MILAIVAGALLVSGIVIAMASAGRGSASGSAITWTVPIVAGILVALVALLLGEQPGGAEAGEELRSTSCAACGTSIIDEWRLCPYCGQLLECDMTFPAEGGPTRG